MRCFYRQHRRDKGSRKAGKLDEGENSQRRIVGSATIPVVVAYSACGGLSADPFAARSTCKGLPALARAFIRPAPDASGSHDLLVRNCRAGWAGEMDDLEAVKPDLAAPFLEIGGRIIKRITEFDQHV
jgi:hypothetical protein